MLTEERRKKILFYLKAESSVQVDKLSEDFDVSLATIRRDLAALEREGLLRRVYGGAVSIDKPIASDDAFKARQFKRMEEKVAIGRLAASLVQQGDTVLLDVGTTTLEVARALKNRSDVTVLTNSLSILNELADSSLNVYSLSGRMRKGEYSFEGSLVVNALQSFHVSKVFLGCGGYSMEFGLTEPIYENALNRSFFIQQSEDAILVTDSSKFGKNSSVIVENSSRIKTIVTDNGLNEEWRQRLRDRGICVLIATPEKENSLISKG